MRRVRFFFSVASATLAATVAGAGEPGGRDAGRIYADLCTSCHGPHLEGGKGGRLTGPNWKHGGDDASLQRSIRQGFPGSGMPAFANAISEAETVALIAFLRETATRQVDPTPTNDRPIPRDPQHSQEHDYIFETLAEGLEVPWSIAFLPNGRMLVTERAGRLRVIDRTGLRPEAIAGVPPVIVKDEAGLMSVVAHPDFARDPWLYLSFSDPAEPDRASTRIIRARLRGNQLVDHEAIFAPPRETYQPGYVLFGGRMVFDGPYLFFNVGVRGLETTVTRDAQQLASPNGKIHRVFHDGRVPPDNPFADRRDAFPSIWAYGVRNPQGLARHPLDGTLWESEHGPRGGDELNRIVAGGNYGWPLVTFGMNYDGSAISDKTAAPGIESPVVNWTPSIAASQIEFYTGRLFPRWQNQLFVGSLATQKLLRLVLADGRVTHTEEIFKGYGRVRDIKTGPDGHLYLALELIGKPGRIVRLVPASPAPTAAGE